jgi:hypothetical protein
MKVEWAIISKKCGQVRDALEELHVGGYTEWGVGIIVNPGANSLRSPTLDRAGAAAEGYG